MDGLFRYWLLVDGDRVAKIAPGKVVEVALGPGRHTLQLAGGVARSPELSFDVASGSVTDFRCRSGNSLKSLRDRQHQSHSERRYDRINLWRV